MLVQASNLDKLILGSELVNEFDQMIQNVELIF